MAMTPAGCAAFVDHGRVVEVHPDLLGFPRAMGAFSVPVGQRSARQPDLHDIVVEIRDLRPAFADLAAEQFRMTAAGENRVGVIVDHDAVRSPKEHNWDRGTAPEAPWLSFRLFGPMRDRAERGSRPVERPRSGRPYSPAPLRN